jgi:DNA-binding NarL/FixJ family response regulator
MTTDPASVTIVIVDDHPVIRDGLRSMLAASAGFEVLGEAAGGVEAVEVVGRLDPDVVLMDLHMPDGDGVAAIAELTGRGLRCRVLVLTTYDTDADVIPAIRAGATGYLVKDALREELLDAVRAAAANRTVLSPSIAARLYDRVRAPAPATAADPGQTLSKREREVLGLVAKGTTNRDIGGSLFISEATVKTHLTHLYAKLGVADRAAAVAVAYERRILTVAPHSRDQTS